MCTTGMLRLGHDDYILFKNKDFGRTHFDDRIIVESEVFGVEGITTWAESAPELDRFSGFSIGANEHGVLCCDSNVRTLEDHASYDDLVEIALREGTDVASGVQAVRRAAATRSYLWGNLMLMDSSSQAAVEVRGQQVVVLQSDGPTAKTNHHTELGVHPHDDDKTTTEKRLASAQRYIEAASSFEDVVTMLESHDDGDTGICNHALYDTVYSYIIHYQRGTTSLHVSQGRPCEKPSRSELTLPLGKSWSPAAEVRFRSSYPSARSTAPAT